jgi:UDP-N-acetylmuramyl-tripeptide synthetase
MKLSELLAANLGSLDADVTRVTDDSRLVQPGDVFVLDSRLGPKPAEYIAMARSKGARLIVADPALAGPGIHVAENPGLILSRWAKHTFPRQPQYVTGVTGTNGKTSVAWFVRELAMLTAHKAASIGTLGLYVGCDKVKDLGYTSPRAWELHQTLTELADSGVSHTCMEVSSHALALARADGVSFVGAGFTNLSPDHRDFHGTMENYFMAKQRLFTELLPAAKTAVVNISRPEGMIIAAMSKKCGHDLLTVGASSAELVVKVLAAESSGLVLNIKFDRLNEEIKVPLMGRFQGENLAVALGLAMASGIRLADTVAVLPKLAGVPGRMEVVRGPHTQPTVVVDYAHTPDALEVALNAIRPQVQGKLWVVFGCGGNRDKAKRPQMGKIAADLADEVVITDDNPRFEDAATIRAEIAAAAPRAHVVGDRTKAIAFALEKAAANDVILLAGKGHESGQIIAGETIPFDDRDVARKLLASEAA